MTRTHQISLLRELYRNYQKIESHYHSTGQYLIDYQVNGDSCAVSYFDLKKGILKLPVEHRELLIRELIKDEAQTDIAKEKKIARSEVVATVKSALDSLVDDYFSVNGNGYHE